MGNNVMNNNRKYIIYKCPTCGSENILLPDEDFSECKKCQEKAFEMLRFSKIPLPKKYKIVPTKYYRNPLYECKDGTVLKYKDAVKSISWLAGGDFGTTSLIMKKKNEQITGKVVVSETEDYFEEERYVCKEEEKLWNRTIRFEEKRYVCKEAQKLWNRIIRYLFYKKQVQSFQYIMKGFITDVWGGLTVKFIDGRKLYIDIQDMNSSQSSSISNLEYYFDRIVEEEQKNNTY